MSIRFACLIVLSTLLTICKPSNSFGDIGVSAYTTSCTARITLEETPDLDGNNLRDYLKVDLVLSVPYEDAYTVDISLLARGNVQLGNASMEPQKFSEKGQIKGILDRGQNKLTVYFSAAAIRRQNIDGPFAVAIKLRDHEEQQVGSFSLRTKPYDAAKFQSQLFTVGEGEAIAIESADAGTYDTIKVIIPGYSANLGKLLVKGRLYAGDRLIGEVTNKIKLSPGRLYFDLQFPGQLVFRSFVDGPYRVEVDLKEPAYEQSITIHTPSYRFLQFQQPNTLQTEQTKQHSSDSKQLGEPTSSILQKLRAY